MTFNELLHLWQDLFLLMDSRMYTGCALIISVSPGIQRQAFRSAWFTACVNNEGVTEKQIFVGFRPRAYQREIAQLLPESAVLKCLSWEKDRAIISLDLAPNPFPA